MADDSKQYLKLNDALKQTCTKDLEAKIAKTISEAVGCTGEVQCSIEEVKHHGDTGCGLVLTLKSDKDKLQF